MATTKKTNDSKADPVITSNNHVEDTNADKNVLNTLVALYRLQTTHSAIDKILIERGELPLEVNDLEDECLGMQTRLEKYKENITEFEQQIRMHKESIEKSQALTSKYKEQLNNVRNNREYDALSKEIEYEELDVKVNEKRINEIKEKIAVKQEDINALQAELNTNQEALKNKKEELDSIIAEKQQEETALRAQIEEQEKNIEPRMLAAFNRIRKGMRNGLATVKIERNACGGCFSKIAPQRQLDIKMHKKVIVCEFCGRILVDDESAELAGK